MLPSSVAFNNGDVDYVAKFNQLVADLNATYAAYLLTTAGALYAATSTTSNLIATGSKSFVLVESTQRAFGVGSPIRIADSAAPATNFMDGSITAYAHPNITVQVTAITGSGTKTAWNLSIAATSGVVPIVSGGTGAPDAPGARTNLGLGTAATQASTAFATAAQGTTADAALARAGGTMSGAVAMGNNNVTGIKLLGHNAEIANTPSVGAVTVDFTTGALQKVTLNAATVAITLATFASLPVGYYQLRLIQDATGGRAVTWAGTQYSATRWGGSGSAPAINTSVSGESTVNFFWDGTTLQQTLFRLGMS